MKKSQDAFIECKVWARASKGTWKVSGRARELANPMLVGRGRPRVVVSSEQEGVSQQATCQAVSWRWIDRRDIVLKGPRRWE
jgi:hypothetical protein